MTGINSFAQYILKNQFQFEEKRVDGSILLSNKDKLVIVYYGLKWEQEATMNSEDAKTLLCDKSKTKLEIVGVGGLANKAIATYNVIHHIDAPTSIVLVNTYHTHANCDIYIQEVVFTDLLSVGRLPYDDTKPLHEQSLSFITEFVSKHVDNVAADYVLENIKVYTRFYCVDLDELCNIGRHSPNLYVFFDNELDCHYLIHYNKNMMYDTFYTLLYFLSNYQCASNRLTELATAQALEALWSKSDSLDIYAIGIGYGALTILQMLPYCQRDFFKKGGIVFFNTLLKNNIDISNTIIRNDYISILPESIISNELLLFQRVISEFIQTQYAYSTILHELETTVLTKLYIPLDQLKNQQYEKLDKFVNDCETHAEIEHNIENIRNKTKHSDLMKYIDLVLSLTQILKKKHGKNLDLFFKKDIVININTKLQLEPLCDI